jgi:primosomal protein N' (replication factor Y)
LQNAVALAPPLPDEIVIFDAVPMSLSRLNGWERAHVLLQASSRRMLQNFLHAWSHALYAMKTGAARWHLEVDPLEF